MMGPHRRLWTIDIAGGGAPKTAGGEGTGGARPGKRNGHRPPLSQHSNLTNIE